MAGLGIRLFTDEDISWRVADALRAQGYDAESTKDAKRGAQRIPDYSQLKYAMQEGRAILTFNRADFERLHVQWQANGWAHHGIIVAAQTSDRAELTRRVKLHLDSVDPEPPRLWWRLRSLRGWSHDESHAVSARAARAGEAAGARAPG